MQVETTKKRFTAGEYHRLAKAGILKPDDRTELIDGEIIQMSPIGVLHMSVVNRMNALFAVAFDRKAILQVQASLRLSGFTEPQPDIVFLRYRPDFYSSGLATPNDVVLVIEVSDTTFRHDRYVKLPHYAAAGVSEYWIANLKADELLVFREPAEGAYRSETTIRRGDAIAVAAFPDRAFMLDEIIG